jgi:hypothetical protein
MISLVEATCRVASLTWHTCHWPTLPCRDSQLHLPLSLTVFCTETWECTGSGMQSTLTLQPRPPTGPGVQVSDTIMAAPTGICIFRDSFPVLVTMTVAVVVPQ